MTTGRTALVQKDKSKGNVANNYRPITYLPVMWKLLTGIISENLYNYLEETNTIPHQQKSCRRKCRGTLDQGPREGGGGEVLVPQHQGPAS